MKKSNFNEELFNNLKVGRFDVNKSINKLIFMPKQKNFYECVEEKRLSLSKKTVDRCLNSYKKRLSKMKKDEIPSDSDKCYNISINKYISLLIDLDIDFEIAFKEVFADKKVDKLLESKDVKNYLSEIDYNTLIDRNRFHDWVKKNFEKLDKDQKKMLYATLSTTFRKDYISKVSFMKAWKFFNFILFMIFLKIDFNYEE